MAVQWLSITNRLWLVKGLVSHGRADRLIEKDEDRNACLMEAYFLFICLWPEYKGSIASNLEGALHTSHSCIVTNLGAEQDTFERFIKKVCFLWRA